MTISKVKSKTSTKKSILKKLKSSSINNPRRSSPVKINSSKNSSSKIISFIKNNKKLVGAGLITSFFGGLTFYNLLKRQALKKIVNECKNDLTLNCFENANKKNIIKLNEKELKILVEQLIMFSKEMDIDQVLKDLGLNLI